MPTVRVVRRGVRSFRWRLGALAAGVAVVAALLVGPAPTGSAATPSDPNAASGRPSGSVTAPAPRRSDPDGRATYYVELTGSSVADTFKKNQARGTVAARAAAGVSARAIESRVVAVSAQAVRTDAQATVQFTTKNVMPGVAIETNAAGAAELRARPDVVSVTALTPMTVDTTATANFTGARSVWTNPGLTGSGIKVGIIDTGIDYTHADFGGSAVDYSHADPTSPDWRSTLTAKAKAKILGGYDFAGDAYDGGNVPAPDKNPRDCYAHGTHVAGILGGYGVTAGGATYSGPYSGLAADAVDAMRIEPGSAPEVQLYALKVFGCSGTTNLVMAALDWALDPNGDHNYSDHLNVVNLSVGSDFGAEDDPTSQMIDKLASYGVLSVVAAGNGGDRTLVGASPGNATSALTVANSIGDIADAPGYADTVNYWSSRGTYGAVSTVKPDLAAPGDSIISAGVGTGNGTLTLTGTSMATPHVAGLAALVAQEHPDWSASQIKADLMNTAMHDVTTGTNGTGTAYGPNRVGSGRVDAALATTNTLLAYTSAADSTSTATPASLAWGVSASFGVVEVPADKTVTKTRTVTLKNTSATTAVVTPSYQASTSQSGVTISVPSTAVTVPGNGTATVQVTLTASGTIGRTLDPTMAPLQDGFSRNFTALTSGRLQLTPTGGGTALRLPVAAAVKPVSETHAVFDPLGSKLTVVGAGFDGSNTLDATGYRGYTSMLGVFDFGGSSTKKPACSATVKINCTQGARDASGDLRFVGATSDYPTKHAAGSLSFAITTWANWTAPGLSTKPYVDIWLAGSNPAIDHWDYELSLSPWPVDADNYDYTGVYLENMADPGNLKLVNDPNWLDPLFDSNIYDTDTVVLSVPLSALAPASSAALSGLHYQVGTYSPAGYGTSDPLDQIPSGTATIAYNPLAPNVSATNTATFPAGSFSQSTESAQTLFWPDRGGTTVPLKLAGKSNGNILVLHQDGASGKRAEVLTFRLKNTVPPRISGSAKVGSVLTATAGTWAPQPIASPRYQWYRSGVAIAGATSASYRATTTDYRKTLTVRVTASRAGYPDAAASSAATAALAAGTFTTTAAPKITGTTKVGYTLTASKGTWSPTQKTYAFQWYRNGVAISGAKASTHKLVGADAGKKLTVKVTVTATGYTTASKTSAATATIKAGTFKNTASPKITGTAKVGSTLKVSKGTWSPTASKYTYQWYRNGAAISSAKSTSYKLTTASKGKKITVKVTVSLTGYTTASKTTAATATVS